MIKQNVSRILAELPAGVELVAAAKTRSPAEVLEAVEAGVGIIGENYVREAEEAYEIIGGSAKWHLIGHLQSNKVKKAVRLFDMIESVDSARIAAEIDRHCARIGKLMPVLVEVNSGHESQKSGVLPEDVEGLIRHIATLGNVRVEGLMTMGPRFGDEEDSRPCFAETMRLFRQIKGLNIPNVQMKYLSMGMTNSYRVAIEEGTNIVRLGSSIFGVRQESG
ncbi:YggS family pyridoxal phosphate-dependent enzyme [Chloroflexota bacterium]